MINRNTLRCASCGAEVTVRISFGLGEQQVHPFACPRCEIEIVVTVDLDQAAGSWRYRSPSNAAWLKEYGAKQAEFIKTFDSNNLIPRDTGGIPAFPFVMTSFNSKDPGRARIAEAARQVAYTRTWPTIRRLRTHFDNRAIALFDKEISTLGRELSGLTWQARTDIFCSIAERFFAEFVLETSSARKQADQTARKALKSEPGRTTDYCREVVGSGHAKRLWNQLWEVRDLHLRLYPLLNALLKFSTWKPRFKLADYYLSEKRFEEIRPLFANAFEALSKLSTLAIAFELLSTRRPLEIPTKKNSLRLGDYDELANGSKPDYLSKFAIGHLFLPYMDNHLRNGIGHNSAHYVIKDDAVWYRSSRRGKIVEKAIDYTAFVYKTIQIVGAVEVAAIFLNWALVLGQKNSVGLSKFRA